MIEESGDFSLITTVLASGAVIESTGALGLTEFARSARFVPFLIQRSHENRTSELSITRPFIGATWGVPRVRSFMVTVILSGENSHESRASPTIVPALGSSVPGFTRVRRL